MATPPHGGVIKHSHRTHWRENDEFRFFGFSLNTLQAIQRTCMGSPYFWSVVGSLAFLLFIVEMRLELQSLKADEIITMQPYNKKISINEKRVNRLHERVY